MAVSMSKFKDAQSVEEVAEILKAEGQDEAKAESAWRELTYQRERPSEELSEEAGVPFTLEEGKALATGGELSDDELAAVSETHASSLAAATESRLTARAALAWRARTSACRSADGACPGLVADNRLSSRGLWHHLVASYSAMMALTRS